MKRHLVLTKEIKERLPRLYSQDGKPNPEIIVKFFTPWTKWTWYATEGEPTGEKYPDPYTRTMEDDYRFFGMVHGHEKELGYFHLSELMSVRGSFGLYVERDMHFTGHLDDVRSKTV